MNMNASDPIFWSYFCDAIFIYADTNNLSQILKMGCCDQRSAEAIWSDYDEQAYHSQDYLSVLLLNSTHLGLSLKYGSNFCMVDL